MEKEVELDTYDFRSLISFFDGKEKSPYEISGEWSPRYQDQDRYRDACKKLFRLKVIKRTKRKRREIFNKSKIKMVIQLINYYQLDYKEFVIFFLNNFAKLKEIDDELIESFISFLKNDKFVEFIKKNKFTIPGIRSRKGKTQTKDEFISLFKVSIVIMEEEYGIKIDKKLSNTIYKIPTMKLDQKIVYRY